MSVSFEKLAPERRGARPKLMGVGACCCCCLHTLISAAMVIRTSNEDRRPRAPRPAPERLDGPSRPLAGPVREVLALHALFWATDAELESGGLVPAAFDLAAAWIRRRAISSWREVYPGMDADARAWTLERMGLLADEGVIPRLAVEGFETALRARALPVARAPTAPVGPLASLWRLHLLYIELAEAAERSELSGADFIRMRRLVQRQALSASLLLTGWSGGASEPPFPPAIRGAATERAREMARETGVDAGLVIARLAAPAPKLMDLPVAGACRVCGETLTGCACVSCATCETPHHADCWSYNGGCALFACGCIDTREGSTSAPPRFDLARPRLDDATPASRAVTMFWAVTSLGMGGVFVLDPSAASALAMAGPLYLMGVALLCAILTSFTGAPGGSRMLAKFGELGASAFRGGVIGCLLMLLLTFLVR